MCAISSTSTRFTKFAANISSRRCRHLPWWRSRKWYLRTTSSKSMPSRWCPTDRQDRCRDVGKSRVGNDMSDSYGLKTAAERGIALGPIGHRIVLENEHVRIWEVRLEPGETIDFHIHYHPYVVISLGGGENEIETIFGQKIKVQEPLGSTVFIDDMRPVHRLTNRSNVTYLSRLVELKHIRWSADSTKQAAS